MPRKSAKQPEGQLSLFDVPQETRDPVTAGSGLPEGLKRGFFGPAYEVGFEIPELPVTGPAVRHGWQVMRDVETLHIGWPGSEEEAEFFRNRIRKYLKTIQELEK